MHTQLGCLDHLKGKRLDSDGIWCSALWLHNPVPSLLALPRG